MVQKLCILLTEVVVLSHVGGRVLLQLSLAHRVNKRGIVRDSRPLNLLQVLGELTVQERCQAFLCYLRLLVGALGYCQSFLLGLLLENSFLKLCVCLLQIERVFLDGRDICVRKPASGAFRLHC